MIEYKYESNEVKIKTQTYIVEENTYYYQKNLSLGEKTR